MIQLDSLIQNPTDDLGKIIDTLRKLHHEFLGSTRQEKDEHMIKLFSMASKENDSDIKWSRIRLNIYSHIIVLQPNPKIIPQISLKTSNGPLFKTITILYLFCRKVNELNDIFKQAFIHSLNQYFEKNSGFYSRNTFNFTQNLPKLLSYSPNECLQIFNYFFPFLKPAALSDSAMSLFKDIFGIVKQMKANISHYLIHQILEIFKAGINYPYSALYYFFNPWYLFYIKKMIPPADIQEQLECLANMIEQSLKYAENEFLQFFQWDICFKLFHDMPTEKTRIKFLFLLLISLKIRAYLPFDPSIIKKLEESSKSFILLLRDFYIKKVLCSLHPTFTNQLIMTFKMHIKSLKPIKCIFPRSPFISRSQNKQIFKFTDLNSIKKSSDQIDSQIQIAIEIYHSNDIDDIKKWFDIFEKVYRCAIMGSIFYSELIHSYFEIIQSDQNNSIPIFYLTELIQTWIKFTIEISYRATHLQRFTMNERESNGLTERCMQYERRLADISNIQNKMLIAFKDIPPSCYHSCSDIIISTIASAVRKHVISPLFIHSFDKLMSQSHDFCRYLTQRFHQYFFENLTLLTSEDKNDVIFLEQWLLTIIKMKSNDIFLASLMLDSQFQAVSTVTSSGKQIIHQHEAVNIMIIYSQFIIDNIPSEQLSQERQLNMHKLKRIQLDDFNPAVRVAASTVFINDNLFDTSNFYMVMQLLMFALKSKNDKTRTKAVNMISKFGEKEGFLEQFPELIYTFFSGLKKETNEETAKSIFKEIPKFSQNFTAYSNLRHFSDLHSFGKNKIPTFEFLCAIEQHLTFDNFEFFNIYHLLSYIFHSSSFEDISDECFLKYLSFLSLLYRYEPLRCKLDKLFNEIQNYYLEKDPTYYFLCLVSISNISRSNCSEYIIQKIHQFMTVTTNEMLINAADRLFSFVPFTNNFFLIVVGLSALLRKSPDLVSFSHIQTIIKSSDSKIYLYYNSLLKLYLSQATPEQTAEFVNYSYRNLGEVLPFFKPILIKRMRKTGLQIDIDKIEYTIDTDFLICYQTAACILCGNLNAIPNTNDFYRLIIQSYRFSDDSQKTFSFWIRGLELIYAIFKTRCSPFLSNTEFLKLFYNFILSFMKTTILKSILPSSIKLAKKTIRLVFEYGKIDKRLQGQLETVLAWPDQEKKNILSPKKIMNLHYYRIISKIMQNKISTHTYSILIDGIQIYSEFNEIQQIQAIYSFKFLLKVIVRIQDKAILVPYINSILNSFGKIFQSQEVSFRYLLGKYLKKIVSIVQNEAISALVSINRDIKNADSILSFLVEDDINIQKQILIEIGRNDYSRIHPQAFYLMSKIIKKNDNDSSFSEIINLQNLFSLILRNYEEGFKNINDQYSILYSITKSLFIETLRIPSLNSVQLCAKIFSHLEFYKSNLYDKFKKLMKNLPNDFVQRLVNFILSTDKADPFTHGLLLKLSIKSLLPINPDLNEILWNFLFSKLTDKNYLLPVFSCLYILVKNDIIVDSLLNELVKNLFSTLTNQNNQLNLVGLKLTYKLIEKKLLPKKIHQLIIIHLLTFPKFFDSIYRPYSSHIISTVEKPYIDNLNDTLTLFITDNLIARKDFGKIIFIAQNFPNLEQNLPFEIFPALIEILSQQNSNTQQMEYFFIYIFKMIPFLQVTDESMIIFSKLCYDFLYKALKKIENINNFPIQFFQFILQKDNLYTPFPDELVKELDSYHTCNYMFCFICFILKFAPYQTISSHFDSIRKKIDFNSEYLYYYSKYFISAALKNQQMADKFRPIVEKIIDVSKSNQESLISIAISSAPSMMKLSLLQKFYSNNLIKPDLCLSLLDKLDFKHQETFIQGIFESHNVSSFCQHIYQLIKSPEVSIRVKTYILDQLIKREEINDIQVTIKIINLLCNKESLIPNVQTYIIRLSVVISYLVDQKSRLILFDNCIKLLNSYRPQSFKIQEDQENDETDDDEVFRFTILLNLLKNKLWNDKCLPFIILLINGEKNQPLIVFSNLLSECSQVSRYTFERLLHNDKCPNLLNFYQKCLKNGNKQVIKDLTIAFQNCKIRLMDELNWKASKYTILTDFDLSTYSNPRLLYPNTFSDYRFGSILPEINKDEMILSINFLLSNYVDNFVDFSQMPMINSFTENDENQKGFSIPLMESIYEESCALYKMINENAIDFSFFFKTDKFRSIQDANLIEAMTMNSFQIKNNLTRFELERIVTIETIVQLQNNCGSSLKLIDLSNNVNSYFSSIIKKCSLKVNNKVDKQETQVNSNTNNYQYFVLSPLFQFLFRRISGYTKHGFLLATLSDIDFSLSSFHLFNSNSSSSSSASIPPHSFIPTPPPPSSSIASSTSVQVGSASSSSSSLPIPISATNSTTAGEIVLNTSRTNLSQNCSTAFNRYKWACFMFNMFFNTPSAILANSTITNLFSCIDSTYLSKLHKYEAATRAITVLRLCTTSDKLMVVVTDSAKKMSMEVTNKMRTWSSQFLRVAKSNETLMQTRKPIFHDILLMFTRYSTDPPEILLREIRSQFDLIAQQAFPCLVEFHNFLNYLFMSGETEFTNNNDQVLRINSILPLRLPSQAYRMSNNSILRIHGDSIHRISENMIVLSAATYSSPSTQYIIEKVERPNEAVSISCALYILNMALKNSYASSSRRINFTSHYAFEIGHDYVLYDGPTNLKSVADFQYFVSNLAESIDYGQIFSPLCILYSSSPFPESFFARRQSFVRSLTVSQFLRNIFCLPQTDTYLFSGETFKVPINIGEFHVPPRDEKQADQFVFKIPKMANLNSPLLSFENNGDDDNNENRLQKILGPSLDGEVMMTVAAISKSLTENIECLRGVLEVLAFDGVQTPNTQLIRNVVDGFQERVLRFTPPDPVHAIYPNYQEWIDNLLFFVGKEDKRQNVEVEEDTEMMNSEFGFNPVPSTIPNQNIDANANIQINTFESNLITADNHNVTIDMNQFNVPYLDNDNILNGNQNKFDEFDSSISQDRPFDDDNPFF